MYIAEAIAWVGAVLAHRYPFIPGHEVVGTVLAKGSQVRFSHIYSMMRLLVNVVMCVTV